MALQHAKRFLPGLFVFLALCAAASAQTQVNIPGTYGSLEEYRIAAYSNIDESTNIVLGRTDDDTLQTYGFVLDDYSTYWTGLPTEITLGSNGGERKIGGTTTLFTLQGYYYNSLVFTLTEDITIEDVVVTAASGSYQSGALLNVAGLLSVDGSTFNANLNNQFSLINTRVGVGGAITAIQNYSNYGSTIALDGATFNANEADGGGAIALLGGTLNDNGSNYSRNTADLFGGGAVLMVQGANATIQNSRFEANEVDSSLSFGLGDGGAISSANSNLNVKGSSFIDNVAEGRGGAIFFASSGQTKTLTIGAFAGETVEFSGNSDGGSTTNSSIVFSGFNALDILNPYPVTDTGYIVMNVDVEQGGTLSMLDPMAVDGRARTSILSYVLFENAQNIDLTINKTGTGTWNLAGANNLSQAEEGAKININAGTFRLVNDGTLLNLTNAGFDDRLTVASGAMLEIGETAALGAVKTIKTSRFQTASGSNLKLNDALNLTIDASNATIGANNLSNIAGALTGGGALTKDGLGRLTFSGTTSNYGGALTISDGIFQVDSTFQTSGNVAFTGSPKLHVTANANVPSIVANEIDLDSTEIDIVGGVTWENKTRYVILQSNSAISGGATHPASISNRDYIDIDFGYENGDRILYAEVQLAWFFDTDAHGTFTIDPATGPNHFTVGIDLTQITDPTKWKAGWNGNSLTKRGDGTLELAVANSYSGTTIVEEGTLLLTHAQGTGLGTSAIDVWDGAALALDFDKATYDRDITGEGQVVKQGNGTVDLGATARDYEGGTVLKGGILAFGASDALGTGNLFFEGGAIRNTVSTTLALNVDTTSTADAKFDTPKDTNLTHTGVVAGGIGLVKTGEGTLTLQGTNTYTQATQIQQGTVSISRDGNLGRADLRIFDGAALQITGTAPIELNEQRNIVLEKTGDPITGSVFDTRVDTSFEGEISGNGKLRKRGSATLTLTGENTYSGGTRIDGGTVEIEETANLGTGSVEFGGGVLRNLKEIANFNRDIVTLGGHDATFDTREDMTISRTISGAGGLVKQGDATLTLKGSHTYIGTTVVEKGTLFVAGSTRSETFVRDGAVLAGSGTIGDDVHFEQGSVYEWFCGPRIEDSPCLNVDGNVYFNNAIFRPVTAGDAYHYAETAGGRTVMTYLGTLGGDGRFALVDGSMSPFFDFELDYSEPNEIRVLMIKRDDPRGLSDAVATGINISNRNQHRRPFNQIDEELRGGRYLGLQPVERGQSADASRRVWGQLYGRSTEFESTYYERHPWRLNSFGVQAGYSFYTSNWLTWGVTAGVELPELKNYRDKIDATDGYLGFYYGRRVWGMLEFKGYVGGGYQHYKSHRSDTVYQYRAKYRGDSFQTNIELARPFMLGGLLVRPQFGFDLGYASQQASIENRASSEFRTYSKASLTQLFFRVGIDMQRRHQRGETYLNVSYSNMIGGQSVPRVGVYYPSVQKGTVVRGADLGQNVFTIGGGGNLYLDSARAQSLFLDLALDVFADRAGGQAGFTGALGYGYRF